MFQQVFHFFSKQAIIILVQCSKEFMNIFILVIPQPNIAAILEVYVELGPSLRVHTFTFISKILLGLGFIAANRINSISVLHHKQQFYGIFFTTDNPVINTCVNEP